MEVKKALARKLLRRREPYYGMHSKASQLRLYRIRRHNLTTRLSKQWHSHKRVRMSKRKIFQFETECSIDSVQRTKLNHSELLVTVPEVLKTIFDENKKGANQTLM